MTENEKQFKDVIQNKFNSVSKQDPDMSAAVAAMKTLLDLIETGKEITMAELKKNLDEAIAVLQTQKESVTSITSGCRLFQRFITNIQSEGRDKVDFEECKQLLLERGRRYLTKVQSSREKIAKLGCSFIKENATILVHSRSRVVLKLLTTAAATGKHFRVYVTESLPFGKEMVQDLQKKNIASTWILDAAIGYIMERIDVVLVGAEGVLASGGIINRIGTYTIAMVAKAHNKPMYVLAESFKFSNIYPLNQQDVPYNENKYELAGNQPETSEKEHPLVDYTPAEYITLLFTDIGILTPTAVSDELIKFG